MLYNTHMPKITISPDMFIPIESARRDIDYGTGDAYNGDNDEHCSEWAMAVAVAHFKAGQEIEEQELLDAMQMAKVQQHIDTLVDKGLMHAVWDDKQEAVVYGLTTLGHRVAEELEKRNTI